jgi:hypothetical protein
VTEKKKPLSQSRANALCTVLNFHTRFAHQDAWRQRRSSPASGGLNPFIAEGISRTGTQIQMPVLQQSLQ